MPTNYKNLEQWLSIMENQTSDVWDLMDLEHHFIYANPQLVNLVGLPSGYQLEGRHMSEPPASCYEVCAADFITQNEYCLRTQQDVRILDVHPGKEGDWFVYIFHKRPLYDDEGQLQGTIHHGVDVLKQWHESALTLQKLSEYYTGKPETSVILHSQRPEQDTLKVACQADITAEQYDVLFCLLCRKSPKEIAVMLNLTLPAVHSRIQRLKEKMGVNSIPNLIERAVLLKLFQHLPARITSNSPRFIKPLGITSVRSRIYFVCS